MGDFLLKTAGKFKINDMSDTVIAQQYFIENEKDIPLEMRREYCVNLSKQMKTFGLTPHEKVAAYAGEELNKQGLQMALRVREDLIKSRYDDEKTAATLRELGTLPTDANWSTVDQVISNLITFDKKHDIDKFWDQSFPNPVFAATTERINSVPGVWEIDGNSVSQDDLEYLATQEWQRLGGIFTDEFIEKFKRDPINSVTSLTPQEQVVLYRMARGVHAMGE